MKQQHREVEIAQQIEAKKKEKKEFLVVTVAFTVQLSLGESFISTNIFSGFLYKHLMNLYLYYFCTNSYKNIRSISHILVFLHVCLFAVVVSNSLQPYELLSPWDAPGKNTGMSCHVFLLGIFLTQGLNSHLLHFLNCRWIFYH